MCMSETDHNKWLFNRLLTCNQATAPSISIWGVNGSLFRRGKGRGEAHCLSCLLPAGLGLRWRSSVNQQDSVRFDMEMVFIITLLFCLSLREYRHGYCKFSLYAWVSVVKMYSHSLILCGFRDLCRQDWIMDRTSGNFS